MFCRFVFALFLLLPTAANAANLVPHEATYRITLGTGSVAPEIGTARNRLGDACQRWSLERDVNVSLALTQALHYDIVSSLKADQTRNGTTFDYRLTRQMNGDRSERRGEVTINRTGGRAVLHTPQGVENIAMPGGTLLPASLVGGVLDRLEGGESTFSVRTFDAEIVSNVFNVGVQRIDDERLAPQSVGAALVRSIDSPVWPLQLTFSRSDGSELFTAKALVHENGVISRLDLTFGFVNLGVELTSYRPLPPTSCRPDGNVAR